MPTAAPCALACPASLKGVLTAREAAAALVDGFADAGVECVPMPRADGGLGAALASLGAELVTGAAAVLDFVGFDPLPYELVVTGEGRVDATTGQGKAPAEVVGRCAAAGVQCVVFGGTVTEPLAGAETLALSGDAELAADDLLELGLRLGTRLVDAAG
jgi:glycerate kinase